MDLNNSSIQENPTHFNWTSAKFSLFWEEQEEEKQLYLTLLQLIALGLKSMIDFVTE
jgi:hypothetical protein